MPKDCPLNKLDSHACWECIFNFGDSCTYEPKEESKETLKEEPESRVLYHKWIRTKDRLPTYEDGKVLIYTPYGISIAERTVNNRWKGDCAIPKLITHWMPLPPVPTKED